MIDEEIVSTNIDGPIAAIRIERPAVRNALGPPQLDALFCALCDIMAEKQSKVIVLSGSGGNFCSGHDLSTLGRESRGAHRDFDDLYRLIEKGPKPVIAAIEGVAAAGGAGLALACDIRIMGKSAKIGWPQVKRGIASVSGPTMLARCVPRNVAMAALLGGEFLSAEEALSYSLVNDVVEDSHVLGNAWAWAAKVAQNAPLAVRAMKEAVWTTRELGDDRARAVGKNILDRILDSEDASEGMRAFRERREPQWRGC